MIEPRVEWFIKNWEHKVGSTGIDHDFMLACDGCCRALAYFLLGAPPRND